MTYDEIRRVPKNDLTTTLNEVVVEALVEAVMEKIVGMVDVEIVVQRKQFLKKSPRGSNRVAR